MMRHRRTSRLAIPFLAILLAVLMPAGAGAQPSAADQLYTVTLRQDAAADEPDMVAAALAATHGATVADVAEGTVTLRLSPTRVPVVAADPRVAAIVPHTDGASSRGVAVTAETMTWRTGVAYQYDGSGNVRKIGTDSFIYDHAGRLVQSDANGIRRSYEYDRYGNRTKCLQSKGTANESDCQFGYAIDAATNRIDGLTYDAAGNVTSLGAHVYTYDALNMQTRDAWAGLAREYVYTADDERLAISDGSTWRWTVRDTAGKVLREFTSTGAAGTANWKWSKDHIWRNGLLLASRQFESGGFTPVTYHYHLDHLGTPRRITDATDRIIGVHDYHAFGPEVSGGQNEPALSLMKFTGHERDVVGSEAWDTLDYMHARYASGTLGRFLSVDPLLGVPARPQSWNRYAYALNSPVRLVDPTGAYSLEPGHDQRPCGKAACAPEPMSGDEASGERLSFSKMFGWATRENAEKALERAENNPLVLDPGNRPLETWLNVAQIALFITPLPGDEALLTATTAMKGNAARPVMVIGKLEDVAVLAGTPGYEVLGRAGWSIAVQDAWVLRGAMEGRTFYLGSKVTQGTLRSGRHGISAFGRELAILWNAGYRRVGNYLVP